MKNFDELSNEIDNLANKLIIKICESPNFENKIREIKKDYLLVDIMYLLVKEEKYEQAVIVRDEMIYRGMDLFTIPEWVKYEKKP